MLRRQLALLAFAACADVPSTGHIYSCTATLVCNGMPYEISASTGCASDAEEALDLYGERLRVIVKDVVCTTQDLLPACVDTGKLCTY